MTKKEKFYNFISTNKLILKKIGLVSIGIFGSVVREEDTEKSDYDILVEFDKTKKTYKSFNALCDLIESKLDFNYDLVTKESLSKYLAPHILKEVENVKI